LTSALGDGEWSASRPGRTLPPGKGTRYPLYRRLDAPQSWSDHKGWRKNPLPLRGIAPILKKLTYFKNIDMVNYFTSSSIIGSVTNERNKQTDFAIINFKTAYKFQIRHMPEMNKVWAKKKS
jgi:hypothetical protein